MVEPRGRSVEQTPHDLVALTPDDSRLITSETTPPSFPNKLAAVCMTALFECGWAR